MEDSCNIIKQIKPNNGLFKWSIKCNCVITNWIFNFWPKWPLIDHIFSHVLMTIYLHFCDDTLHGPGNKFMFFQYILLKKDNSAEYFFIAFSLLVQSHTHLHCCPWDEKKKKFAHMQSQPWRVTELLLIYLQIQLIISIRRGEKSLFQPINTSAFFILFPVLGISRSAHFRCFTCPLPALNQLIKDLIISWPVSHSDPLDLNWAAQL